MTIFNKLFVVYSMIKQKNISMSYLLCYNISGDYMKYPTPIQNKENYKKTPKVNGVIFENALNISNEYYRLHDIAFIYKKPTPVQIVRVDYPQRTKAKITEAYYKTPSTTDYNGIYRGKYIDYEAKETNNLSFSFKHIFEHQINHLVKVNKHGGLAFVIIYFKKLNEVYLIDIPVFYELYLNNLKNGIKSISINKAREIGKIAPLGYTPPIDYLKAVDQLYF